MKPIDDARSRSVDGSDPPSVRYDALVDVIRSGAIVMTWDQEARLATIGFERDTNATGRDAALLVEALAGWVGGHHEPFGLLGDGARLRSVDAEYRATWSKFFRLHREDSYIAFFNMGPVIRIAAEMFRVGTGLHLKAFADEAQARAWLRQMGVAA